MSHTDALVYDGVQQQEAGESFSNMELASCVDLLATYGRKDLQSSIS